MVCEIPTIFPQTWQFAVEGIWCGIIRDGRSYLGRPYHTDVTLRPRIRHRSISSLRRSSTVSSACLVAESAPCRRGWGHAGQCQSRGAEAARLCRRPPRTRRGEGGFRFRFRQPGPALPVERPRQRRDWSSFFRSTDSFPRCLCQVRSKMCLFCTLGTW